MKNFFKKYFKHIFLVFTIVFLSLYMYFVEGIENIRLVFYSLSYKYLLYAIVAQVLMKLTQCATDAYMRSKYQKGVPFLWTVYDFFISNFLTSLTPQTLNIGSATYIACMNKQGLAPSKGTVVILIRQACFTLSTIAVVVVFLLLNFSFFSANINWFIWLLFALAILINVITILIYVLAARFDKFIKKIVYALIMFLSRIKLVKRKDELIAKAESEITKLKENMTRTNYTFLDIFKCFIGGCLVKIFLYSTNYFSALALNINLSSPLLLIAVFSFFDMIASVVPIPGGFGVNEMLYHQIVFPVVGANHINFMMMFYRIVTFYFSILIDAVCFLFRCPSEKTGTEN